MEKKEQNTYLIMYVLMDFLRFVKDLKASNEGNEKEAALQVEQLQVYVNLYLKSTLGEQETKHVMEEMSSFLS